MHLVRAGLVPRIADAEGKLKPGPHEVLIRTVGDTRVLRERLFDALGAVEGVRLARARREAERAAAVARYGLPVGADYAEWLISDGREPVLDEVTDGRSHLLLTSSVRNLLALSGEGGAPATPAVTVCARACALGSLTMPICTVGAPQ